jgi:hypothetical protein
VIYFCLLKKHDEKDCVDKNIEDGEEKENYFLFEANILYSLLPSTKI